jgi:glycosyltransferase involved in cell wall biosynthesis
MKEVGCQTMSKVDLNNRNIAIMIPDLGTGGAERVASELSSFFTQRGYCVYIITYQRHYRQSTIYDFKGKLVYLKTQRKYSIIEKYNELSHLVQTVYDLRSIKNKYNIKYSISFMEEFNLLNVLSRSNDKVLTSVRTILSEREDFDSRLIYYNKYVLRLVFRLADLTVVQSEEAEQDMKISYGVPRQKMCIIHNPVFVQKDIPNHKDFIFGEKDFLSMARIHEIKQLHHMIRAFSKVASIDNETRLLFVGQIQGKYIDYLESLIGAYGLDERIIFVGQCNDILSFYLNCRALVLTSKTEGMPNSVMEGLAVGIPIIAADCKSGLPDLLDYKHVMVKKDEPSLMHYAVITPKLSGEKYTAVEPLDQPEEVLAEAMQKMIENDEIYSRYKNIGKEYMKEYDMKKIGSEWEHILSSFAV